MERYLIPSYGAVFLWGIAVLLGMIGLGRLVTRAVGGEPAMDAGWGLHAVWGMSVFLFVGGLLSLFGACGSTSILLLVGAGLAVLIWTAARGGLPTRAALAAIPWTAWPAFAAVALTYAGAVCWQRNVEPSDDLVAYYGFCEKLLSTGSFDEPFSWRRLASLGGHTLLQCSVLARASYINAQTFEVGLCPVILLGLVLGFRRGALGRSPLGLLIGFIAVTTPIFRVNTASHLTGAVMFLGLFVTLDLAEREEVRRLRLLALAGCVAAGLCSLRAQFVPAAGAALGLFWVASWLRDRRLPRATLIEAGCWGGALFVALLPWMIGCWLSNGSPLFPLFQGGNNRSFNPLVSDEPWLTRFALPVQMILAPSLLPLLLCLLAAPDWKRGLSARAISMAAVLASLALAYTIPLAPDQVTVPRYVQPMLLSGALAALMAAAVSPRRRLMAWVFGALLIGTSLQERGQYLWNHYTSLGDAHRRRMAFNGGVIADYREAQLLVPEGRRILVCGDFPFLLDYARNPIWIIDMPNAASPAPGLPFHKPPEETKRYLRSLGVEYLIFGDFAKSASLYNRATWQGHANGDIQLWKIQSPFYLDFFDTADRLAASETALGRVGNLTVIQFKP
jgi:hypothetical protein